MILTWNVRHFPSSVLLCTILARGAGHLSCKSAAQRRLELVTAPEYVGIGGGQANDFLHQV
jgi:hypothetical protein